MYKIRNLMTDWRKDDGEKMAIMGNEAASAWPGGGWQVTAEDEERYFTESDLLAAFITEDGDRIVSICTIDCKPGQKVHCYIPFLNCHPDYHGKKYGKAVLWAAVDHAYQLGFEKVDLHTWPGNLKAVPLYKKMGFMWQPESSVTMENFTPTARRHPLGQAFFVKHDWYDTHQRVIELKEDVMMRGNVKIYEYRWEAENGDFLRMVFDRQSWQVIEVENNDLLVGCQVPDEKLVAGMPHAVQWRVENKKAKPAQVFLNAPRDAGIDISYREVTTVTDGETFDSTFVIDPEIEEKKTEPKASVLRTDLVVDDNAITLGAGVDVEQAVDVSVNTARVLLQANKAQTGVLALQSNLGQPCKARVSLNAVAGARVGKRDFRVDLKAKGGAEIDVPLVTESGQISIDVDVEVSVGRQKIKTKTQRLDWLAIEPQGVHGSIGDELAFVYGGGCLARVKFEDGSIWFHHVLRGQNRTRRFCLHCPQVGPPFSYSDLFQEKGDAWFEKTDYGLALHLRSASQLKPGLIFERSIEMTQGPIVKVTDKVVNGTAQSQDLTLKQGWQLSMGGRNEEVMLRDGNIYCGRSVSQGGRDFGALRVSNRPEDWPEGWFCQQRDDGCAIGLIWGDARIVEGYRWGSVQLPFGKLKPGEFATIEPFYIFVGDGNWQTVRGWWQTLLGGGTPLIEDDVVETTPVSLAMSPNPIVIKDGTGKSKVSLRNIGQHAFDGEVVVASGAGVRADVKTMDVSGVQDSKPFDKTICWQGGQKTKGRVVPVDLAFETDEAIYSHRSQALVLPTNPQPVTVDKKDDGLFTVDNGIVTFSVAPAFRGGMISLQRDGREYLNCFYPEPGIRGAMNPYHGGIHPASDILNRLYRERFRGRVIKRKGAQGLIWEGVRVSCVCQHERHRGKSLSIDYLLAPGVEAIAIAVKCKDTMGVWSDMHLGVQIWPDFPMSPQKTQFWVSGETNTTIRTPAHYVPAARWQWGGLVTRDGRGLFVGGNGAHTRIVGESIDEEMGVLIRASVEKKALAYDVMDGLFFVLPGHKEDGERQAIWNLFAELP